MIPHFKSIAMPVYIVLTRNKLTAEQKELATKKVTDVHCGVTGAPSNYVTVMFLSGYRLKRGKKIMLMANIRIGGTRSPEVVGELRKELIGAMEGTLNENSPEIGVEFLGVKAKWVYEGRQVLPDPGQEKNREVKLDNEKNTVEVDFLT